MASRLCRVGAAVLVGAAACASTSIERREYILAHPHGWVELSLDDRAVPLVPESEEKPDSLVRPESCSVYVSLDREPFVSGSVYPVGDAPPFAADSGFRFPAPLGPALVTVEYAGCDVAGDERSSVTTELYVAVEENRVVEVHFDGEALRADPPREDRVVTLEDVYEAVTGRKKGAP
jgi:hypothetical protein